jgi:hypothetical protein
LHCTLELEGTWARALTAFGHARLARLAVHRTALFGTPGRAYGGGRAFGAFTRLVVGAAARGHGARSGLTSVAVGRRPGAATAAAQERERSDHRGH